MGEDTGLILALDITDAEKAVEIARRVAEYVDAIKVNYPLVLSAGIDVIAKLADLKPVVADFKIADIPYTSSLIADIAFRNGASAVIAHGFAGSDTLKAILDVADKYGGEVYVVTELSSEGGKEFLTSVSSKIAELARELGCHGIIAPATRVERVAELRKIVGDLKVITPGVGAQGGKVEDVIKAGADYIIVGRSIYNAEDPESAAKEFKERIKMCSKF
jgi:orotidine-5'-phosphate decarboxylase